uniref:Uncharacterized protein n=2 Tax=Brassica TaxID=3705 RepID=A0A0D3DKC6_BRAOL
MLFRRWDPGSQGIKRNRSDLYYNETIGRILGRNGVLATRVILVLRRILWVGANTGSAGSVLSLGSSKWMRNQEDQSKDYQGLYWCLVICWRQIGRTGNKWDNWSSLRCWIYFPVLFTALQTLNLVPSNQLQRRDTDMEKTMRCLLKGVQVDDRVVPRMAVKSYLLFSIICLSWVKLILATFVIFWIKETDSVMEKELTG